MESATNQKSEELPQLADYDHSDKFAEGLEGRKIYQRYEDVEYEVYPNRDPRLDEIESWEPGNRR